MESLETTAGRMKALADELCEQAKHAKVDNSQRDGASPSPTEQKLLLMLEKNKQTMAQMTTRIKELYAEVEGLVAHNEELARSLEEAKGLNCTTDGAGGGGGTLADVVQRLKEERAHRLQAEEQYASIITQQEETTRRLEERLRQAYTVIEDYEAREAQAGGRGPLPPSGVSPPSARFEEQQQQPHVARQQAREPSAVPPTLEPSLGLGRASSTYAAAAGSSPAASRAPSLPGYAAAPAPPSSAGSPDKTFNYNNCVPPAVQTMREQQPRQQYHQQQQPQQQVLQQQQQQQHYRQHPSQPQQQQQQEPRYHPSGPHASTVGRHPVRPSAHPAQPQPQHQPPQSLPASSRSPSSAVAASSSNGLSRSVTPSGHYDVVTSFLEDMRQALDSMNEEEAERAADIQLSQAVSHAKGLTPRGPPTAEAIARSVRKTGM